MKLLFDQNLSPRLVNLLWDLFPDSRHVQTEGLASGSDEQIWEFARDNGFIIVSKDEDYNDISVLRGNPPKLLWLQLGNCTTNQVEAAVRSRYVEIKAFAVDPALGTFVLN